MFFNRSWKLSSSHKKVLLPSEPQAFVKELISWRTDKARENASLLLGCDVLNFMKSHALSYYDDSYLVCILNTCIVIGSYERHNGRNLVILAELLLKYPKHETLYVRTPGKLSPVMGLYVAHLEEEE